MSVANTQVSSSLIRVDQGAASVEYQNSRSGVFGLEVAPIFESAGLQGEFMSLAGNGLINRGNTDIRNRKSELAPVGRTSMRYARQLYDIYQYTHSSLKIGASKYADLLARGVDVSEDYLRRHHKIMVELHSLAIADRFASTGADRAFTADATAATASLIDNTGSFRAIVEAALEFFHERGAFGSVNPGVELLVVTSRRVSRRIRDLIELAETTSITNLAASGESIVRSGFNTESRLAAMVASDFDNPIPMRLVIDNQYDDAGDPFLDDSIYFVIKDTEAATSFVSTPVPDWGQTYNAMSGVTALEGGYGAGEFAGEAGGSPLGIVVENEIREPLGRGWHMEQEFGLLFYGESGDEIERNLGYRVPVDLGS